MQQLVHNLDAMLVADCTHVKRDEFVKGDEPQKRDTGACVYSRIKQLARVSSFLVQEPRRLGVCALWVLANEALATRDRLILNVEGEEN